MKTSITLDTMSTLKHNITIINEAPISNTFINFFVTVYSTAISKNKIIHINLFELLEDNKLFKSLFWWIVNNNYIGTIN